MKNNQKTVKEHVVFAGEKFTIEWYFDSKGKSRALNYFESLGDRDQIKLLELFELMGNVGEIKNKNKFRSEGEKIYAFKPHPYRFLCFFYAGQKIILTNAFHKKTDKLPQNEKLRALEIMKSYEERIERGDYYD